MEIRLTKQQGRTSKESMLKLMRGEKLMRRGTQVQNHQHPSTQSFLQSVHYIHCAGPSHLSPLESGSQRVGSTYSSNKMVPESFLQHELPTVTMNLTRAAIGLSRLRHHLRPSFTKNHVAPQQERPLFLPHRCNQSC